MAQAKSTKSRSAEADPFRLRRPNDADGEVHVFGKGFICDTDTRGYRMPRNRDRAEIVLDAPEGFIPLWAKGTTLRWRFQERSMRRFRDPDAAKAGIRQLLGEALLAWDNALPVRFTEHEGAWDFEIVVREADRCGPTGCVLASAFFPDAGRHELVIYPKMFQQSREEQVETLVHEMGHVFGLRHFFAEVTERAWPFEVFGEHKPFTIMNYGEDSELTDADRNDLRQLYQKAWSGELTHVNGTPIRFVKPYHTLGEMAEDTVAAGAVQSVCPPSWAYFADESLPVTVGNAPGRRRSR